MSSTLSPVYGTSVSMTTTNLASLANATVTAATATVVGYKSGWQSAKVDNYTATKAMDFFINVKLTMAATNPANDKAIYVYGIPWYYDGSTWYPADWGTGTLPTGSEGTANIGDQGDHKPLVIIPYNTTSAVVDAVVKLSSIFGGIMPDGWSLGVINYSGAAVSAASVLYKPINYIGS